MAVPKGWPFMGDGPNPVKDRLLTAQAVRNCRERRLTPEAQTIVAPQPGIRSRFWAEQYRFALVQYHQGQVAIRVR